MSSPPVRIACLFAAVSFLPAALAERAVAQGPLSSGIEAEQQLRIALDEKLNQPVTLDVENAPLESAVGLVAQQIKTGVYFDVAAIEEEGLAARDVKVSLQIAKTPLPGRHVLELLLEPLGLHAVNHNGVLVVTIMTQAEEMLDVRVYDVGDIIQDAAMEWHAVPRTDQLADSAGVRGVGWFQVPVGRNHGTNASPRATALTRLSNVILQSTDSPWEIVAGAGGTIIPVGDALIIRQTDAGHREIQAILDGLREGTFAAGGANGGAVSEGIAAVRTLRSDLDEKLNDPIELNFGAVTAQQAVRRIAGEIGADLYVDLEAIAEEGLSAETIVEIGLPRTEVLARQALHLVLRGTGLVAVNHNGLLFLTTESMADEMMYLRVYDVREIAGAAASSAPWSMGPDSSSAGASMGTVAMSRWRATMNLRWAVPYSTGGHWVRFEGTGGSIMPFNGRLVVRQTAPVHYQIQRILDGLPASR